MRALLFSIFVSSLAGCSHFVKRDDPQAIMDRQELQRIEDVRDDGEIVRSCAMTDEFIKKHPNSVYFFSARLQEGRCFEDAARLSEAAAVYKDVREKTVDADPGLPARAEWRLSFIAEAQGDDFKALAHLLGAERRASDLPERVARVELPSRKAMLSFRLGHDEDGQKYFLEAERGLRAMLASPEPKPNDAWLSRLYLEMGRSQVVGVDADNLPRFLRAQQASQPYLLKAMRSTDQAAATSASQILRTNYTKYWNAVARMSADSAAGAAVASRLKREKQIPLLNDLLKIVHEAQAVQPPADAMTNAEKEFFAMTDVVSESIRKVLYSNAETTVLTEESRVLNGVHRALRESPPEKTVSDPNL